MDSEFKYIEFKHIEFKHIGRLYLISNIDINHRLEFYYNNE